MCPRRSRICCGTGNTMSRSYARCCQSGPRPSRLDHPDPTLNAPLGMRPSIGAAPTRRREGPPQQCELCLILRLEKISISRDNCTIDGAHGAARRAARLSSTAAVAGRAGKGGTVNIELVVVIAVFGPIILIRFLRSLANHAPGARCGCVLNGSV